MSISVPFSLGTFETRSGDQFSALVIGEAVYPIAAQFLGTGALPASTFHDMLELIFTRTNHACAMRPDAGCSWCQPSDYLRRIWHDSVAYESAHLARGVEIKCSSEPTTPATWVTTTRMACSHHSRPRPDTRFSAATPSICWPWLCRLEPSRQTHSRTPKRDGRGKRSQGIDRRWRHGWADGSDCTQATGHQCRERRAQSRVVGVRRRHHPVIEPVACAAPTGTGRRLSRQGPRLSRLGDPRLPGSAGKHLVPGPPQRGGLACDQRTTLIPVLGNRLEAIPLRSPSQR